MITSIETKLTNEKAATFTWKNPISSFLEWAEAQEFYRLPFLVGMILFQGCVTAPFSLWAMHVAGGGDYQLTAIVLLTFAILTSNLSAQPTKITIPIFTVSTLILLAMTIVNVFTILM